MPLIVIILRRGLGGASIFKNYSLILSVRPSFIVVISTLAHDPTSDKQRRFLDFLDLVGYTVRTKKVKFIRDQSRDEGGFHKGNLDVELTIDAVHTLLDYRSFVLLSGDSDFAPLLKFLKAHGRRCVVMSTKGSVALDLVQQAKFVDLKKLQDEIELAG